MTKILLLLLALITATVSSAQPDTAVKVKTTCYSSIGISIGHVDPADPAIDNFSKASYPSMEIGLMRKNISLGAVLGCENMFVSPSSRGFYELKTSISHPLGDCSGYALFGVGAYFEKEFNNFLEYGLGFSYAPKKVGYFVQYSNWARTNYISTGLIYNF